MGINILINGICYNNSNIRDFFKEDGNLAYYVRLMHREDIDQVTEIDREAFPNLLPPANYKRELENRLAHYIVVCDEEKKGEPPLTEALLEEDLSDLRSKLKRLFSHNHSPVPQQPGVGESYITGFIGFWIMAGEAHITSIAVRKCCRCQGIGELLFISAMNLATELDAHIITLEVRVSNTRAQSLYYKCGFANKGMRRNYYVDDREDAMIMSIDDVTTPSFQVHLQRLKQAHSAKWGVALYQIGR